MNEAKMRDRIAALEEQLRVAGIAPAASVKRPRGRPLKGAGAKETRVEVTDKPARVFTKDDVREALHLERVCMIEAKMAEGMSPAEAKAFGLQHALASLEKFAGVTTLAALTEDKFEAVVKGIAACNNKESPQTEKLLSTLDPEKECSFEEYRPALRALEERFAQLKRQEGAGEIEAQVFGIFSAQRLTRKLSGPYVMAPPEVRGDLERFKEYRLRERGKARARIMVQLPAIEFHKLRLQPVTTDDVRKHLKFLDGAGMGSEEAMRTEGVEGEVLADRVRMLKLFQDYIAIRGSHERTARDSAVTPADPPARKQRQRRGAR